MLVIRAGTFAAELEALRVRAQLLRCDAPAPGQAPELTSTPERYGVYMQRLAARRAAAVTSTAGLPSTGSPKAPARGWRQSVVRFVPLGQQLADSSEFDRVVPPCERSTTVARQVESAPSTQFDGLTLAEVVASQVADDDSAKPLVADPTDVRVGDTFQYLVHDVQFGWLDGEMVSRPVWCRRTANRTWYKADAVTYRSFTEMGFSGPETLAEELATQDEREGLDILAAVADPDLSFSDTHHTGSVESEFAWLLDQIRLLQGSYSEMLAQAVDHGYTVPRARQHFQLVAIQRNAESLTARFNARRCVHALALRRGDSFKDAWDTVMSRKAESGATYTQILDGYVRLVGRLNMAALLDPDQGHVSVEGLFRLAQPSLVSTPSPAQDGLLRPLLSGPHWIAA